MLPPAAHFPHCSSAPGAGWPSEGAPVVRGQPSFPRGPGAGPQEFPGSNLERNTRVEMWGPLCRRPLQGSPTPG